MALECDYLEVWKWFVFNDDSYQIYWVMFDPAYSTPWSWDTFEAENITSTFNMSWFQQWLEVAVAVWHIHNDSESSVSFNYTVYFDQRKNGSWVNTLSFTKSGNLWAWYWLWWNQWFWVDPDEFRPNVDDYRVRLSVDWNTTSQYFSTSNWGFSPTVCNAGYLWVENLYLCYVPPCYYSWSSSTWYKHIIQYDDWYSWSYAWTENAGKIWIPSSSSDHHIYYVTRYWYVYRTKESYKWRWTTGNGWYYVDSDKAWFIWMPPSNSYDSEPTWYNYLCYIDWWWYRRRMWVWEIT